MSALALLLAELAFASTAPGEVLERILAVVDGRPVLLSEVELSERLRGVDRAAALEGVIDERLMFQEAARLPQAAVSVEDEETAYRSLGAKASAQAVGASEEDLRRLARRQSAILKYVEFRFRPQVRVTAEAVHAAYEAEYGGRADAPAFDAVAEGLKERLARRDLDERIEAWVKELRASAEVRYN